MSRYPVIDGVSNSSGQQLTHGQKAPRPTEVARRPQSRRRADEYCFLVTSGGGVHPDHRVNALQLRMSAQDLGSSGALERSKPQGMLPLVPQQERHARRTEPARPIIQQQRGHARHPPVPEIAIDFSLWTPVLAISILAACVCIPGLRT
jgi:hypothetical protein